jgi:hypothetical protein
MKYLELEDGEADGSGLVTLCHWILFPAVRCSTLLEVSHKTKNLNMVKQMEVVL